MKYRSSSFSVICSSTWLSQFKSHYDGANSLSQLIRLQDLSNGEKPVSFGTYPLRRMNEDRFLVPRLWNNKSGWEVSLSMSSAYPYFWQHSKRGKKSLDNLARGAASEHPKLAYQQSVLKAPGALFYQVDTGQCFGTG